jgi:hypothetical protein
VKAGAGKPAGDFRSDSKEHDQHGFKKQDLKKRHL